MCPPKGFNSVDACIVKRGIREIPEFGLWFLRDSLEFAFLFLERHSWKLCTDIGIHRCIFILIK
jgi:hypothetical protein